MGFRDVRSCWRLYARCAYARRGRRCGRNRHRHNRTSLSGRRRRAARWRSIPLPLSKTQPRRPAPYFTTSPLGAGDMFTPTSIFRANNLSLANYILFAYKIAPNQEQLVFSQLPKWVLTDRFDIQATTHGNPTKDQMRLMMQTLLVDHFRLAAHFETRQVPVFALLVDQPGKLGPLLQRHPDDAPCPQHPSCPARHPRPPQK